MAPERLWKTSESDVGIKKTCFFNQYVLTIQDFFFAPFEPKLVPGPYAPTKLALGRISTNHSLTELLYFIREQLIWEWTVLENCDELTVDGV